MNEEAGSDLDDPTAQALLRAARGYHPPARLRRRVRQTLGLPVSFSLAATVAFASTGAGKVLLVTAAVIGAGGGGLVAHQIVTHRGAHAPQPPHVERRTAKALPAFAPTTAPHAESPSGTSPSPVRHATSHPMLPRQGSVSTPRDIQAPVESDSVAPPAPARPAATSAEIAAEIDLLDRVQEAVRRHEFQTALGRIIEHDRRFPHGALTQETDVLRISALLGADQRREAVRRARLFLDRNGDGVLGERVKAMLSALPQTSTGEPR